MNNIKPIYVKITDKYLYIYENGYLYKKNSKYIKNGKVDNVIELIDYLKTTLDTYLIKRKYIFILDNLLNNSDLFVYNYVFKSIGILDYKILNDLYFIKNIINNENIIVSNWSSSITYTYINNNELVTNLFNRKIINKLNKKYLILIGDTIITNNINKPIYNLENKELVIFNCLKVNIS